MEVAWAQRDGHASILALDWQRAFDSINPDAMIAGLRRFGVPEHMLKVIGAIYTDRRFQVNDCGQASKTREQHSGISQGCPLSPFLFVMIMTIIMSDARDQLTNADKELLEKGCLAELLYADDTLLLSVSSCSLERYLAAVAVSGARFGLELHPSKFQLMQIRTDEQVRRPDGSMITPATNMVYLGTLLTDDGRVAHELARRLGMASAAFRTLSKVWRHSSLSRTRKIQIYSAVVLSKLLYGLATAWLNTSERRRLDGFHNRCLRTIWGIKPAYISRVSNKEVLDTTGQKPITTILLKEQLLLYGAAARAPEGNVMRDATFCPRTLHPATNRYIRKIGRPRLEWADEVGKVAFQAAGSYHRLNQTIKSKTDWRRVVDDFCNT
jgi:hypothetical protein